MSQITTDEWKRHQEFEINWHGDCLHTLTEELKQVAYAPHMGLTPFGKEGKWPYFDLEGKSVVDVGGGPSSILLKCVNRARYCAVVDPCDYPIWVGERYFENDIVYEKIPAEKIVMAPPVIKYDIALCYNVLQHTIDPEKIVNNMRNIAKEIRLFEWVNTGTAEGHPHDLNSEELRKWLGVGPDEGETGFINEQGAVGFFFAGVFKCDSTS